MIDAAAIGIAQYDENETLTRSKGRCIVNGSRRGVRCAHSPYGVIHKGGMEPAQDRARSAPEERRKIAPLTALK